MKDCFKKHMHSNTLEKQLHQAIRSKNRDWALRLMEQNVNIDWQDASGTTALMLAAHYGNHDILTDLIDAGCDLMLRDNQGHTARDAALRMSQFTNRDQVLNTLEFAIMKSKNMRAYIKKGMPTKHPVKRPSKAQFKKNTPKI